MAIQVRGLGDRAIVIEEEVGVGIVEVPSCYKSKLLKSVLGIFFFLVSGRWVFIILVLAEYPFTDLCNLTSKMVDFNLC